MKVKIHGGNTGIWIMGVVFVIVITSGLSWCGWIGAKSPVEHEAEVVSERQTEHAFAYPAGGSVER